MLVELIFKKMVPQVQQYFYPNGGHWLDVVEVPVYEPIWISVELATHYWFFYS